MRVRPGASFTLAAHRCQWPRCAHFEVESERYRAIFDAVNDAIVVYGLDPLRILDVNARWRELFGCRPGDASRPRADDVPALDLPGDTVARAVTGEPQLFETLAHDADGRAFWLEISLRRADLRGRTRLIAIARDISARKRHEEALARRSDELARSNAELEQFAYVASHDLQEPLRMISSYLELLVRRHKDRLEPQAEFYIRYAVDGAARMQRLILDLLAFSRVATHGRPLEPADTRAALDDALANLRVASEQAGAVVTIGDLPVVDGDRAQLTQLFQNLVGNALKFRRPDRAPAIAIGARPADGAWRFHVADNGIGIEPRYRERVFKIFQRLHTREEYEGTGMGLAICRRIVERHGGRIWVEETDGGGSTFVFTIARG